MNEYKYWYYDGFYKSIETNTDKVANEDDLWQTFYDYADDEHLLRVVDTTDLECAILSSSILLADGLYKRRTITVTEAKELMKTHVFTNFVGHETVKVLGIEPLPKGERPQCRNFDVALVVQPFERLDFGHEYSVQELQEIGYRIILVEKVW